MFGGKKKKAELAARLMTEGATAVATLVDVIDTGMSVNESIRVKLRFRIEPLDGSAGFAGEKAQMVSRVRVPAIGGRYPAFYDTTDPSQWVYVRAIGDETARQTIIAKFGNAFGSDASGIGMPGVAAAPAAPVDAAASDDPMAKLKKLGELRAAGVLTDEEFAAKKAELMSAI